MIIPESRKMMPAANVAVKMTQSKERIISSAFLASTLKKQPKNGTSMLFMSLPFGGVSKNKFNVLN